MSKQDQVPTLKNTILSARHCHTLSWKSVNTRITAASQNKQQWPEQVTSYIKHVNYIYIYIYFILSTVIEIALFTLNNKPNMKVIGSLNTFLYAIIVLW